MTTPVCRWEENGACKRWRDEGTPIRELGPSRSGPGERRFGGRPRLGHRGDLGPVALAPPAGRTAPASQPAPSARAVAGGRAVSASAERAAAAPDLIEPVSAFRNWRLVDGVLRSPYAPVAWPEPVMCARCLVASHAAPAAGCDCGVSAYLEPQTRFPTVDFRGVTGIVTLWGHVEVHPGHVRAEYARVEAL